jgi:hypothetical protein
MNKTILVVISLLALVFTSVLKAEMSLSGYQEFFAGSADQSIADANTEHGLDKSGMTNGNYSRITATASSTLDSGIEVSAYYNMARGCRGSQVNNCGVAVNGNGLNFSGGFGTIGIGEQFDVGAGMYSRQTAANPVAEPDGGMLGHFYSTDSGTNEYGTSNETNWAQNDMKIRYNSNVYSGFSFAVGYTPNTASKNTSSGDNATDNNYVTSKLFSDVTHIVGKYTMEMDGVGLEVAYGQMTGNAGTVGATSDLQYNDLEETIYSAMISYAGVKVDYRKNEAGNSGELKNGNAGNDEGTSICATYYMANIGVGACEVKTSFIDTNNFTNSASTRTYSADYNLGGGATIGLVYFDTEQTANNVTRTDADGLVSKLSFGF